MLRVPAHWACASSPVALVQINDDVVAICTVLVTLHEQASWELNVSVTLSPDKIVSLVAQDFSDVETREVFFLNTSQTKLLRFVEAPSGIQGERSVLRIRSPRHTYIAKSVLCEGPRVSPRGTPERLFGHLAGRYVFVGCEFDTDEGHYSVHSIELQSGYRGLSLVCGATRVRLNHRPPPARCPASLVGLDAQARELRAVMATAAEAPGRWTGVCVRAPEGCGASALVERCAADCRAAVARWSPGGSWMAGRREELAAARLVVLVVGRVERSFPAADGGIAHLAARVLRRDLAALTRERNGAQSGVVLLGILRGSGEVATDILDALFAMRISVEKPDVDTRAALIALLRGGRAEEHMGEAHALVGQSSEAVLAAARAPCQPFKPPIKAFNWAEIGGLDAVKDRLRRALVLPRLQSKTFARFGVIPPRGILLYGPPGCAKTSLVKALCSEGLFSLIYLDSAGLISAYVGESERQLRDVFRRAAQQAPCIVFFDEVEVLGGRRRTGSSEGDEARLLSTLLTEMDGFTSSSGVCFVGATNTPHLLDSALLRPGRFDYLVYVPLPPRDDRRHILSISLSGTSADVDRLADATEGFSGADLTSLCTAVLLELLKGSEREESAPDCLRDATTLTELLLSRARVFHKTAYDVSALEQFHKNCSSFPATSA